MRTPEYLYRASERVSDLAMYRDINAAVSAWLEGTGEAIEDGYPIDQLSLGYARRVAVELLGYHPDDADPDTCHACGCALPVHKSSCPARAET